MSILEDRLTVTRQITRTPKRDRLIQQGIEQRLTLRELGASIGLCRESARLYLIQLDRYETWREIRKGKREGPQKEQQLRVQFLSVLKDYVYQKAGPEGWAMQKAVESFYVKGRLENSKYSIVNLLPVFEKYGQAQKEGKKLSLVELAEGTAFRFDEVGTILREIGLEPMHGKIKRTAISNWKAKAINRAYKKVPMPAPDIAYFLGLPPYVVAQRFMKKGKRDAIPLAVKKFGFGRGYEKLSYRVASQIYEAVDLGFNKEEATELLKTTLRVVDYALAERSALESKITNALQILYPEQKIEKPYRNQFL